MNRTKYLLSVLSGVLAYVLLSLSVGQNSLRCYKNLQEQKQLISLRTVEIQNINSELTLEHSALQNDKDVIAAYARKLDYVSEGEQLVKINGLKPAQNTLYDIGKVLRYTEITFLSEKICKIIGLFFAVMTFAVILLYDLSKGNIRTCKKQNVMVAGIPVYEVKQI